MRFGAVVDQAAVGITETDSAGRFLMVNAAFAKMSAERASWSRDDVMKHLETNHRNLASHIETMSEDDLARIFARSLANW